MWSTLNKHFLKTQTKFLFKRTNIYVFENVPIKLRIGWYTYYVGLFEKHHPVIPWQRVAYYLLCIFLTMWHTLTCAKIGLTGHSKNHTLSKSFFLLFYFWNVLPCRYTGHWWRTNCYHYHYLLLFRRCLFDRLFIHLTYSTLHGTKANQFKGFKASSPQIRFKCHMWVFANLGYDIYFNSIGVYLFSVCYYPKPATTFLVFISVSKRPCERSNSHGIKYNIWISLYLSRVHIILSIKGKYSSQPDGSVTFMFDQW